MESMHLKWTQEEINLETGMDLAFYSSVRYCRSRSVRQSHRGTSTAAAGTARQWRVGVEFRVGPRSESGSRSRAGLGKSEKI